MIYPSLCCRWCRSHDLVMNTSGSLDVCRCRMCSRENTLDEVNAAGRKEREEQRQSIQGQIRCHRCQGTQWGPLTPVGNDRCNTACVVCGEVMTIHFPKPIMYNPYGDEADWVKDAKPAEPKRTPLDEWLGARP